MKDEIRAYLATVAPAERLAALGDGESLFEAGLLDSVSFFGLIVHLEKTYGLSIDEGEITPENFESIESISNYVTAHRGRAQG